LPVLFNSCIITPVLIVLIILLAYLIGAIPFGVIIGRIFKVDIMSRGSKNIGATNVVRTVGVIPGILVLTLDLLKGTLATYLAIYFLVEPLLIITAGLAAILGHMFPVYLKFKGGKGAAVGLGVLLAIAPTIFLYAALWTVVIVAIFRYVSLASITGPILIAVLMYYWNVPLPYLVACLMVAILMVFKHIPNIKRLLNGTERKFGEKAHG
jgi:glycerol-3-phosphate acyltransferase PlsY